MSQNTEDLYKNTEEMSEEQHSASAEGMVVLKCVCVDVEIVFVPIQV